MMYSIGGQQITILSPSRFMKSYEPLELPLQKPKLGGSWLVWVLHQRCRIGRPRDSVEGGG